MRAIERVWPAAAIVVFCVGCVEDKGPDPLGTWSGDPGFLFDDHSFRHDANPIEGKFKIDINSGTMSGVGVIPEATIVAAMTAASNIWTDAEADVDVRFDGGTESGGLHVKGSGHDVMMQAGSIPGYHPAKTTAWTDPANPEESLDCDITLYEKVQSGEIQVPVTWMASGTPSSAVEYHIQTVLTHELGHCLGFLENGIEDGGGKSMMKSFSTTGELRTSLHPVDVEALVHLYGEE